MILSPPQRAAAAVPVGGGTGLGHDHAVMALSPSHETVADLEDRLARKERELAAVHRIACALRAHPGLDDLIQQTLVAAIEVVSGSAGSILLHDPARDCLIFRYVIGATPEITERLIGQSLAVDQGIAGAVFQSGRGVLTPDARRDERHYRTIDETTAYCTQDMITVALWGLDGAPLGVMEVLNHRAEPFTEADLEVLDILAGQAALALETAAQHTRALTAQAEKQRFSQEVLRVVTGGKLHLVSACEVPTEGELLLDLSLDDPNGYRQARETTRIAAEAAGMDEDAVTDLVLAASEAIGNATKHAVRGRCSVWRSPDRLLVRVTDQGQGIDTESLPATLLQPGFSTKVSLGMGYELILKLVDTVWLATGPQGTVIQIAKWLRPEDHPVLSAVEQAIARLGDAFP
jgi:anti-sigma regulatory factor (Ser/Thr protein kinase)